MLAARCEALRAGIGIGAAEAGAVVASMMNKQLIVQQTTGTQRAPVGAERLDGAGRMICDAKGCS